jgi:hypothetical protein
MKTSSILLFILIICIFYILIRNFKRNQEKDIPNKSDYSKGIINMVSKIANGDKNKMIETFEDIKDIRYGRLGASNMPGGVSINKWIKISSFVISGAWDDRGFTLEVYPRIRGSNTSRQTLVCLVKNNDGDMDVPYVSLNTINEYHPDERLIKDVKVIRIAGNGVSNNKIEVWIQFGTNWAEKVYVMYYLYNFKTNDFIALEHQPQTDAPPGGQSWGVNDRIEPLNINGEISKDLKTWGQFRAKAGTYGTIFRQDGADFYLLNTNNNDPNGAWNGLRPFRINNASGDVYMSHNVNVGATLNTPDINRVGGDWLRVNDRGDSVGRTALYGKLSINDTRNGMGGLVVGDWDTNPGQGGILATNKICINNTCVTENDLKQIQSGNVTTNTVTANNVKLNKWNISDEGPALVFRDTVSGGDKRFALWGNRYRDWA